MIDYFEYIQTVEEEVKTKYKISLEDVYFFRSPSQYRGNNGIIFVDFVMPDYRYHICVYQVKDFGLIKYYAYANKTKEYRLLENIGG